MTRTNRGGAGRRQGMRGALAAAVAVGVLALAACGTATPPRFHSLTPAPSATAPAASKITPSGQLAWEVMPVSVPPGVDQPQWVVRSIDGSLVVLEQERWIGPLAEEIRAAVTTQLTNKLGPPSAKTGAAVWRVRIDVLRFETAPGREARIEAVWSLLPGSGGAATTALRCSGNFAESSGVDGYLALAAGHRRGVSQLADAIAADLAAVAAGKQEGCTAA